MQKENIFQTVFHLNTKSVDCLRTIVNVVWPCSRVESQMKPRLCLGELTWVEPAIQSETSSWSAVNLKKKMTLVSSKLEPAIWSRDTGQRIHCFDRCQLIKTWMSNVKDVYWSHWHTWRGGRTYVSRTVDDVMGKKPKFLASEGYHILLTMVLRARVPLAREELCYNACKVFCHF